MSDNRKYSIWFLTGSQNLYGQDAIKEVQANSEQIVKRMNESGSVQQSIEFKGVMKTSDEIRKTLLQANAYDQCAGVITWMHTFSPAKMWIAGLKQLGKPLLHFHTQYHKEVPWESIDMDFMNINQSAHGDREFGFITEKLNIPRKIITGHWDDEDVLQRIGKWMNVAAAHAEGQHLKIARFGGIMRNVAVTEGDKVEAEVKFGWKVHAHGIGEIVDEIGQLREEDLASTLEEYESRYKISKQVKEEQWEAVKEQAKIEVALEHFLEKNNYQALTTNFEDLNGMKQLPGLAIQRLMEKGYGFGGEGDWKTAGLVRIMKIISGNKKTSFMEDYTYHWKKGEESIIGSHMLEVCPTIAGEGEQQEIQVNPLTMGGKEDPSRLVFKGMAGEAVNAAVIDLGERFRLVVNKVNAIENHESMPHLPVATIIWQPTPSMEVSTESWITAGGAHHTCLSFEIDAEDLKDYAEMVNIECAVIDEETRVNSFKDQLRSMSGYWKMNV
ncbi:L-arabinose isomerase [Geomicrobium halophilum]|uniref:L-arabinose isomerase n=1 Tax=Geomicrobium halophilum TaxID=549000 RepID=A0A841PQ20_9BACL|nr:L-arabinose isomerase [Geomicrobium halophilum]MBB6450927.1 L-arabinose isomerase [Geomicrobium halophilum]